MTRALQLPASAIDLIESGAHAHLVTINPDGSPQGSMVWSMVDDGEICVPSMGEWTKIHNVRRDPRVLVSYESHERDARTGLLYYLVVKGRARVTEGGAPEGQGANAPASRLDGEDDRFRRRPRSRHQRLPDPRRQRRQRRTPAIGRAKAIGIFPGGRAYTGQYIDSLAKTEEGWRIRHRTIWQPDPESRSSGSTQQPTAWERPKGGSRCRHMLLPG
jgi:PPOX class probable F420-dependent enzyme